jgi:hypothetical protein
MKKYHLFLDGVYPSSENRMTKLGNDGLTLCLDYSYSYSSTDPVVCHPIKHIPSTPNSTIDAGYFVVPNYMNETMGYIDVKFWPSNL